MSKQENIRMGESREINPAVAIAVVVVIIAIVGFFLWRGTGGSTPRPAPGQTLQNPFGSASPGPSGAPAMPSPR